MNAQNILDQVDVERIYNHVLKLEGERHPLRTPERLRCAAEYIRQQLADSGVSVRLQEFGVPGHDDTFYNVEGWTGEESEPAAALLSHYDTYYKAAGANDNAAAVAVTLEIARVFSTLPHAPATRFLSFTLEETNPALQSKVFHSAWTNGVMDADLRYTSHQVSGIMSRYWRSAWGVWKQGSMPYSAALAQAATQTRQAAPIPPHLWQHMREIEDIYEGVLVSNGNLCHLGSHTWVNEALASGRKIKYAICLDEIGATDMREGSQRMFPGLSYDMLKLHRVEPEKRIGNWAFIVTDGRATRLGSVFCAHAASPEIALPYAYIHLHLNFQQILQFSPHALGSDHAPFWKAGIPALALIDTAALRSPFGHTLADTIDRLDFAQIERICKTTLATLLDTEAD